MRIFLLFIFLISANGLCPAQQAADPKGHKSLCYCDTSKTQPYIISDYESALDTSVIDSANAVAGSIALDLVWAKQIIKEFAPHLVPEKLDEGVNELLLKFKKFMEKAAGPLVLAVAENARLKLQVELLNINPEIKYHGVYMFESGKFQAGAWDGVDQVFDGDSGASASFKAETEFNAGISFIANAEFKIQIVIQGSCTLSMMSIASQTKFPNAACVTQSGFPHGKINSGSKIEAQAGISAETGIGREMRFTHSKREILTLCADEKEKVCP